MGGIVIMRLKSMYQYAALFFMLGLSACASSSNSGSNRDNGAQQQNPYYGSGNASALSDIGAASMFVNQNGRSVTLAQVAASSPSQYTLFEFVGVSCEACKTETPFVGNVLNQYSGRVSRTLIFPNQVSEYQTSDYMRFSSSYAGNSPYVIDDTLAVLKRIRANSTQFFCLFILLSKDGRGLILNQDQSYTQVDSVLRSVVGR
jgi:hypothetical protein